MQGGYNLLVPMTVGAIVLMYFRFIKSETTFNKLLFYTSLSFLAYGLLQSPVFPKNSYHLEIAYFSFKYTATALVLLYFYKKGSCNLLSYLILLGFLIDSKLIAIVNLGIMKSSTEYYSVLEATIILVFMSSIFERKYKDERWSQKFAQCVKLLFMTKGGSLI